MNQRFNIMVPAPPAEISAAPACVLTKGVGTNNAIRWLT